MEAFELMFNLGPSDLPNLQACSRQYSERPLWLWLSWSWWIEGTQHRNTVDNRDIIELYLHLEEQIISLQINNVRRMQKTICLANIIEFLLETEKVERRPFFKFIHEASVEYASWMRAWIKCGKLDWISHQLELCQASKRADAALWEAVMTMSERFLIGCWTTFTSCHFHKTILYSIVHPLSPLPCLPGVVPVCLGSANHPLLGYVMYTKLSSLQKHSDLAAIGYEPGLA